MGDMSGGLALSAGEAGKVGSTSCVSGTDSWGAGGATGVVRHADANIVHMAYRKSIREVDRILFVIRESGECLVQLKYFACCSDGPQRLCREIFYLFFRTRAKIV
jgi:hypothetical protein